MVIIIFIKAERIKAAELISSSWAFSPEVDWSCTLGTGTRKKHRHAVTKERLISQTVQQKAPAQLRTNSIGTNLKKKERLIVMTGLQV